MIPLKIRIPTEQYAFVEVDVEINDVSETKQKYDEVKRMFDVKSGLDDKTWRECLDRYLTENTMDSELYNNMSEKQQNVMQEIKKAIKRINKE